MPRDEKTCDYYKYWGKARPLDGSRHLWHSLPYHSLDVAACASELLRRRPDFVKALSEGTGLTAEETRNLVVWMCALHDVGKFSDRFQWQVPELARGMHPDWNVRPYMIRHDSMGYELLSALARKAVGSTHVLADSDLDVRDVEDLLGTWFQAVTGHHGSPPLREGRTEELFRPDDVAAALKYAEDALELFGPVKLPPWAAEPCMKRSSWLLAGITTLADWIGSDQNYFGYDTAAMPLSDYFERAQAHAAAAVEAAGVLPNIDVRTCEQRRLFAFIEAPTPAQEWAANWRPPEQPSLVILEDVTGSGKTEAALTIAARLMKHGRCDGLYVALPTMATANGMFPRILSFGRALFSSDDFSLLLSHGARRLFRALAEAPPDSNYGGTDDEISATSHARAWLSDTSKKALLSQFGVGTVDQALLGVLPSRFSPLRLVGLFRKVLLVDEVHAYDTYTSNLLENLLRFHAQLGGHAVLLSATLPQASRHALAAAFCEGANYRSVAARNPATDYPLVTEVRNTGTVHTALATAPNSDRTVQVQFIHSEDEACEILAKVARQRGCAAWIRNTIDGASRALELLGEGPAGRPPILFHSRFMAGDRARIETQVLDSFGKASGAHTRAERVVCATQVIEQSLDLDFDAMVTDLAPVDLLLQRAGRLQRHKRDRNGNRSGSEGRPPPTLYVLAPHWTDEPDASWMDCEPLGGSRYVYSHTAVLWRTMRVLMKLGGLRTPEDSRKLVESVYADAADVPAGLVDDELRHQGGTASERSLARLNQLKLEDGYTHRADVWLPDTRTPTRLGQDTTTLRLAKVVDGDLHPAFEPDPDMRWAAWEFSEIRVPTSRFASPEIPGELEKQVHVLQADARFARVTPVYLEGSKLFGRGADPGGGEARFSYCGQYGLRFEQGVS